MADRGKEESLPTQDSVSMVKWLPRRLWILLKSTKIHLDFHSVLSPKVLISTALPFVSRALFNSMNLMNCMVS